ncbi:hypothetical protein QYF36_000834 [Acer negundo]|nr:hypothetical protein QYF36_000834 [Acer negundo]
MTKQLHIVAFRHGRYRPRGNSSLIVGRSRSPTSKTEKKEIRARKEQDLNKACPKDSFPLPLIDMQVDAIAGHELLSFMDAYYGGTYQLLVNKMFVKMLGSIMEVYINDMLVKSLISQQHIEHLRQSFDILDQYNMKLNLTKCFFGVSSRKFLGYPKSC